MKIWELCNGYNHLSTISIAAWRVVEAQHISSSRDLVASKEEHDLLEEMLEAAKPYIAHQKHYLIFTPFRYPPLQYGSRFGRQHENSLWYGSIQLETALAEVAYYRLKFFDDTSADLEFIEIPLTAFQAFIHTQQGIDLTIESFVNYREKISHKKSYEYSQTLGTDMRKSGIEAFIFFSARAKTYGKNMGAYTPEIFRKNKEQYIANMQNWQCLASKQVIEFTRFDISGKSTWVFSQDDFI